MIDHFWWGDLPIASKDLVESARARLAELERRLAHKDYWHSVGAFMGDHNEADYIRWWLNPIEV